jgi:hypothetical protein
MKALLFIILALFLLTFMPMSEAQKGAWNHFWAIKPDTSNEEVQAREVERQQQYNSIQQPISNNNLNNYAAMDDILLYKLQKKPFGGPFGETQFEYVLRRW